MHKNLTAVIFAVMLMVATANAHAATAGWDTLFYDDFTTEKGWTVADPFVQSPYWHGDTLGAYSGNSFWCGTNTDTAGWANPPGYGNGWAQFLTSPQFDLTGITADTVLLSLWHHYNLESPGGGDWDCINVWIDSTGDSTWSIAKCIIIYPDLGRFPAAAYNLTDAYSWKYIGLVPDWQAIPGWGGTNGGWNKVGFDLTPYKGKKVRVCFVACSDPAESDQDGGPYHGMWYLDDFRLDTVSAGGTPAPIFFDNLDTDTLIPWLVQSKPPAYFWHKDDVDGNKFWMARPDSSVEYTWNQRDGLVSPFIAIPADAESCYADFILKFPDPITMEGGHDNYNFEISQDSGKNWVPLSLYIPINQYADSWVAYNSIYGNMDISGWLGKTVQFRISFYSDGDSLLGEAFCVDDFIVMTKTIEGVEAKPEDRIPNIEFKMTQNSPNPFSSQTTIKYQIPKSGMVNLKVYNIQGQLVKILDNGYRIPGYYEVKWDGRDEQGQAAGNGVYFCKLNSNGQSQSKKIILMR